ncbi:MAG: hypothetical protein JHC31_13165 [Sulfurihydrogenibium sp.]|nr:hypothetical protein [Sulfurihydrogenibium sp.]
MPTTKREKAKERITLKKFLKVIFKSKFKEDYIIDLKNTCYKFIDNLTSTCCRSKHPKKLLDECFERIDEYTDICSDNLPDFYLRSKVDGIPDLAIELKTLERDHDRFADYKEPFEVEDRNLTVRDLKFVIRLNPPGFVFPSPIGVLKLWDKFENELKEFEKRLEYIVDAINILEKKLEDENQDMYLKDLSREQKKELVKVIRVIRQEGGKLAEYTDFIHTLSYFEIWLETDGGTSKIGDFRKIIKRNREFLKQYIKYFLEDYFNEKVCKNYPDCLVSANIKEQEGQENQFIFTVRFSKMWKSEDINFHVEKIVKFIEDSKKKFEKLREVKSDKLDKNPHLELLLVKVTSFAIDTFESHVKELYEKLMQRGYNYPFYSVKELDDPLSLDKFFMVPSNFSVLSKFYLICMNSKMELIDKQ